jgi:hypothetical protein
MEYTVDAQREEARPLITNYFTITGLSLDPRECTRLLGIEPTETSKVVQRGTFLDGRPHVREAFWSIEFSKEPSWEIEGGLLRIIDILWPQRRKVVDLLSATGFDASFGTNVTIHASRPLYILSPQTLSRLSYFGAEYGLDIFDNSE